VIERRAPDEMPFAIEHQNLDRDARVFDNAGGGRARSRRALAGAASRRARAHGSSARASAPCQRVPALRRRRAYLRQLRLAHCGRPVPPGRPPSPAGGRQRARMYALGRSARLPRLCGLLPARLRLGHHLAPRPGSVAPSWVGGRPGPLPGARARRRSLRGPGRRRRRALRVHHLRRPSPALSRVRGGGPPLPDRPPARRAVLLTSSGQSG